MEALDVLGLDPKLAAQAAASFPLFAGCFALAKKLEIVPSRFELLLAAGMTAGANVLFGLASGAPPLHAASAAASGALLAMIVHATVTK